MFVLIGFIAGEIAGATLARRRRGSLADILLYGFVYGLLFALAGLFVTIIVHRMAL